jgi:outer membrane lipoprotein-sorting protein
MMKKLACLVLLAVAQVARGAPPSGREILEKQEEVRRISTFEAKATLTTSKGQADKKTKKFRWWRKLKSDNRFITLTRFDEPATIRGEGLLIREAASANDVLLYLPRFKKVRRVETQSQSSSFFGSVFSYADIAMSHADENKAKVLREDKCPGQELKCWVVEITPANEAIRDRTGYSRSVQWIRQDNWITVYGEFFDKKDVLWKRLTASEVKEVDTKAHKWIPHLIQLEDVPGKRLTVLRLADVKVNAAIEDAMFTEQSLANE